MDGIRWATYLFMINESTGKQDIIRRSDYNIGNCIHFFLKMSENKTITIREMHSDDIGKCMLLSEAERWNQTETDWKRLIYGPQNHCLVAESENRIVGTATAMNYSNLIAWIGMVLIDKDFRGRGIAKELVSSLLNLLNTCKSIKLDATPAGQTLYEKLGFKNEYLIHRMIKSSEKNLQDSESKIKPESIQPSDISEISSLDFPVFGAERSYLLYSLYMENSDKAFCIRQNGRISGFLLGRKGRHYFQIGPVVAQKTIEAKELILSVLDKLFEEHIVVDVLDDKPDLIQWLKAKGFIPQRQFYRMYLNENPFPGSIKNNYLICGPEFG
jgi:GNAT superfamily N-acetyltransferase